MNLKVRGITVTEPRQTARKRVLSQADTMRKLQGLRVEPLSKGFRGRSKHKRARARNKRCC